MNLQNLTKPILTTPVPITIVQAAKTGPRMTGVPGLLILITLLVWLFSPTTSLSASLSIDDVFEQLASAPIEKARFVEQRRIAELDDLVESRGELEFAPPSRLVKRTLLPIPETLTLDGNTLTVEQGDIKRELQITDMPGVSAFVASLRGFVGGRREEVESAFTLTVSSKESGWVILGTPSDNDVSNFVSRIEVSGVGARLIVVEIELTNGDHSTLTILQ